MRRTTVSSSPSAVMRPNAPWHRQMTRSNSASKGMARASMRSKRALAGAEARAMSMKDAEMSMPVTSYPRAASSSE